MTFDEVEQAYEVRAFAEYMRQVEGPDTLDDDYPEPPIAEDGERVEIFEWEIR